MTDATSPSPDDPDYDWDDPEVTDEKLEALKMEREIMELSHVDQIRNLLLQAAPQITLTMIQLATSATNENTRMNAGKYVLEKVLDPDSEAGKGVLEGIVSDLVKNVEDFANTSRSGE